MKIKRMDTGILNNTRRCSLPKRYIVTFMAFCGITISYCFKTSLSVAIVAMVNQTKGTSLNSSVYVSECPGLKDSHTSVQKQFKGERYNWDPAQQGLLLSAYFYGYSITMFFGGFMASKIGAVRLFGLCHLVASVLTLFTTLVVQWGLVPLFCLRFLEGVSEGPVYPSTIAIISIWSPKMERGRMTSIIFAGASVGSVISYSISGILSSSELLGGWPSVYYFFGCLGCIWYLFWRWLIYENPHVHPNISKEELEHFNDEFRHKRKDQKVPWKHIALSLPCWALVFSSMGNMFGVSIIATEIPTYLNSILHFNIKSSGFLTALPHISQAVGAGLSSLAADKILSTNKFNTTIVRKIFNSIAGYGPTICLILISYSGCQSMLIVCLFTLQLFLNGFKYSGFMTSYVDMSPQHAGLLHGLTTGIGNVVGSFAPTMAGAILAKGVTIANWRKVFCITAGIYFIATTAFALFGSAELQPWSSTERNDTKNEENASVSTKNINIIHNHEEFDKKYVA